MTRVMIIKCKRSQHACRRGVRRAVPRGVGRRSAAWRLLPSGRDLDCTATVAASAREEQPVGSAAISLGRPPVRWSARPARPSARSLPAHSPAHRPLIHPFTHSPARPLASSPIPPLARYPTCPLSQTVRPSAQGV